MRGAMAVTVLAACAGLGAACGGGGYPELANPAYLRTGSPRAVAADLFGKAMALEPDRIGPLEIAGRAYLANGYDAEADKLLERILMIAPGDGYNLADIAAAYIEARRDDQGLRFWTAAKKAGGTKARTWAPVAAAWARVGNVARADEFFAKLLELPGGIALSNTRKHRDMGLAWLEGGDKARAEDALATALRLSPDDGLQMLEIGAAWLAAGERAKGEALMKKGFDLAKGRASVRANRDVAAAYIAIGDLALAEPFAKAAITLDPEEDDTYLALGRAFIEAGRAAEAEDMLSRALRAASEDWELLALVGAEWLALEPAPGRKSMRAAPAGAPPLPPPAPADGDGDGEPLPG